MTSILNYFWFIFLVRELRDDDFNFRHLGDVLKAEFPMESCIRH